MPTEVASTWPTSGLLPAIRRALTDAEEALLCVAFLNQGVGEGELCSPPTS